MPSPQNFDVFLSHSSKEKPAVERIAEKLKREEIEPWLDKWCLTIGGDWQDELAAGLRSSSSCAVFIGPNGIGDWERLEFKLATDRMAKDRNFRVFLVLLPELPDPFDTSELPPFLTTRTWVDLRKGAADPRTFQQLVNAIKGLAPGPEMPIEARNDVCPYRGLQTFDEAHAEFFFGRDGDIQRLIEKLKTTRLLAVVGASGSGKSSLVRAGLLPALKKGALPGSEAWPIQVFTPGARPLTQLTANLQRLYPQTAAGKTLDELNADERALHLQAAVALADRPSAERVVLVVDQFEEVFTLCNDETERKQFIANLLYAALAPGGRIVVLLTMRADFYQKCAAYPELSAQIIGQQFLVSPMNMEGLRQAISEPAWRVGLEFEPGLVETILDDIESQPGALPLLEHALLELWERRRARLLTLEGYRESGGVEGAIAKRADAIYESFDAAQQTIVRRIMLRLTQPGEGTEDTRRRATMSELITRPDEADKVHSVVQTMADARLLMTDSGTDTEAQTVDVSHEALIRSWPRLRRWIDEDRQGLRVLRRVTEAAQEWQKAKRDESLLFRGARLAQAVEWRERSEASLNDLERNFLTACTELRNREQRAARQRTRRVIFGLVVALVLISAASIYAFLQSRIATKRGTEARARELAANAMAQLPVDPELALILAIEAAKTAHSPETENTLRQALARAPLHLFPAKPPSTGRGKSATFSPDGKNILIANDKKLQTYDVESGRIISEWEEDDSVDTVAYSPDGKLISAMVNMGTHIREAATGRSFAKHQSENGGTWVFSPDGQFLILTNGSTSQVLKTSSGDVAAELEGEYLGFSRDRKFLMTAVGSGEVGTLFRYDTASWKLLDKIPTTASMAISYPLGALSPDGTRAFVGRDKDVGVYDINEKRLLRTLRIVPEGEIQVYNEAISPVFSPDGRYVAFAANRTLQIWDTSNWEITVLGPNPGYLLQLSFSPDSRFLLATDNLTHFYDVHSKRLLTEFSVSDLEFSPDGKYVLARSADSTIGLWDLNPWRSKIEIATRRSNPETSDDILLSADLSPDEKLFITTHDLDTRSVKRVWELGSGRMLSETQIPNANSGEGEQLSPDGKLIMETTGEIVRTRDASSGKPLLELKINDLEAANFSPDGKLIVTASDQLGQWWDANTGAPLGEFKLEGDMEAAVFSTSGKFLLITDGQGTRILDISSKQIVLNIPGLKTTAPSYSPKTFSPDDKLFLGIWDHLEVREASTGRIITELRGHVDEVVSAAFSPDSKYVVSASEFRPSADINEMIPTNANEVRVWDASSGSTIYEFLDHSGPVRLAKFNRDGKLILAADYDGTVRLYACDLCVAHEDLLKLAQKRRMRELTPDERARYQIGSQN